MSPRACTAGRIPPRRRAPLSAAAALLLALGPAPACRPAEPAHDPAAPAAPGVTPAAPAFDPAVAIEPAELHHADARSSSPSVVEGLLNGGFEWTADATSVPPKAGAYWLGAFATGPGVPDDLVEQAPPGTGPGDPDGALEGGRFLRLPVGRRVSQKIVAHPGRPEPLVVSLDVRAPDDAHLAVIVEDGPGRSVELACAAGPQHPHVIARRPLEGGWVRHVLDLAGAFGAAHGEPPQPRLWLHLEARGSAGRAVDVDGASALVALELIPLADLRARIEELAVWQLQTWLLPRGEGGLGLVDPATGYVTHVGCDVETGRPLARSGAVAFHTIHRLLIQWLQHCERAGRTAELQRWRPHLRRIVGALLEHNFDPDSGLPRNVSWPGLRPLDDTPVTVGSFVEFLLEAHPLLDDPALAERVLATCRGVADALIALQQRHDLDPEAFENTWRLDADGTTLVGEFPNWYGHIPNKLTPKGVLDTPRRFNTAWAVVTRRSFWYHVFKSAAAIMAVHELDPRPGDLDAVHRVVSLYQRDWDAHRYQLENDTDDHYGYLCEDVLAILRHSGGELTDALALVQQATDHRLERDGRPLGDTLWINGARLGTPCAGDSPRAIKGLLDLYALPPAVNPATSGLPLYRDAILELAANDWKGRQLTNGQFTESFFKHWEMVCICYRGNVQDDCRNPPPEGWHGDVGDTFGGPPGSSIDAQVWAYAVADEEQRTEIRGRIAALLHVTDRDLRREHGYLYGLDEAVARRYELPDKYVLGLSAQTAAGLGTVVALARLLPELPVE